MEDKQFKQQRQLFEVGEEYARQIQVYHSFERSSNDIPKIRATQFQLQKAKFWQKYGLTQFLNLPLNSDIFLVTQILSKSKTKINNQVVQQNKLKQQLKQCLKKHKIKKVQQFHQKPIIQKIYQSINARIMKFKVYLNYFQFQIQIYNEDNSTKIQKFEFNHLEQINQGGYSQIYNFKNDYAIKKIIFNRDNSSKIIFSTIIQYCYCKLASAFKIGLQTISPFGFDIICTDNQIFFSMQLGIKHKRIFLLESQKELAESLLIFHNLRICHFDIKQGNVQFSSKLERFVFIDFGLSQTLRQISGFKTKIQHFKGTYGYCSKEMQNIYCKQYTKFNSVYIDAYYNDIHCFGKMVNTRLQIQNLLQFSDLQFKNKQNYENGYFSFENAKKQQVNNLYAQLKVLYQILQRNSVQVQTLINKLQFKQLKDLYRLLSQLQVCQYNEKIFQKYFQSKVQDFQQKYLQNYKSFQHLRQEKTACTQNQKPYIKNTQKYHYDLQHQIDNFQMILPLHKFKNYLLNFDRNRNKLKQTQKNKLYYNFLRYVNWNHSIRLQKDYHVIVYEFYDKINQEKLENQNFRNAQQYLAVRFKQLSTQIKTQIQHLLLKNLKYVIDQTQKMLVSISEKIQFELRKSKTALNIQKLDSLFLIQRKEFATLVYIFETWRLVEKRQISQELILIKHLKHINKILMQYFDQTNNEKRVINSIKKWNQLGSFVTEYLNKYVRQLCKSRRHQINMRRHTKQLLKIYQQFTENKIFYCNQTKQLRKISSSCIYLLTSQYIQILKQFCNFNIQQFAMPLSTFQNKCIIPIKQCIKIQEILRVAYIYLKKEILSLKNYVFGGLKQQTLILLQQLAIINPQNIIQDVSQIIFQYCIQIWKKQKYKQIIDLLQNTLSLFLSQKNRDLIKQKQSSIIYIVLIQVLNRFYSTKNNKIQRYIKNKIYGNQSKEEIENQLFKMTMNARNNSPFDIEKYSSKITNKKRTKNNFNQNILEISEKCMTQNKTQKYFVTLLDNSEQKVKILLNQFDKVLMTQKFTQYQKYQNLIKLTIQLNNLKYNIYDCVVKMQQILKINQTQVYQFVSLCGKKEDFHNKNLIQNEVFDETQPPIKRRKKKIQQLSDRNILFNISVKFQFYSNLVDFIQNQNDQFFNFTKQKVQAFIDKIENLLSESQFWNQQVNITVKNNQIQVNYNSIKEIKKFMFYQALFFYYSIKQNHANKILKNQTIRKQFKLKFLSFPFCFTPIHMMILLYDQIDKLKAQASNRIKQTAFNSMLQIFDSILKQKCHMFLLNQEFNQFTKKFILLFINCEFDHKFQMKIKKLYIFQFLSKIQGFVFNYESQVLANRYIELVHVFIRNQYFKKHKKQILLRFQSFFNQVKSKKCFEIQKRFQKHDFLYQIFNILNPKNYQNLNSSRHEIFSYLLMSQNIQFFLQQFGEKVHKKIMQDISSILKSKDCVFKYELQKKIYWTYEKFLTYNLKQKNQKQINYKGFLQKEKKLHKKRCLFIMRSIKYDRDNSKNYQNLKKIINIFLKNINSNIHFQNEEISKNRYYEFIILKLRRLQQCF